MQITVRSKTVRRNTWKRYIDDYPRWLVDYVYVVVIAYTRGGMAVQNVAKINENRKSSISNLCAKTFPM